MQKYRFYGDETSIEWLKKKLEHEEETLKNMFCHTGS